MARTSRRRLQKKKKRQHWLEGQGELFCGTLQSTTTILEAESSELNCAGDSMCTVLDMFSELVQERRKCGLLELCKMVLKRSPLAWPD